ncbi:MULTISPECIES: hypothetical protein [Pseudofrankia]|uniref:hypothetical protein n=1 Tax=Pseudofrankia TaxID=2994363 RepID=UPI000234B267|nr:MULTISPECIES: hypothetical protein [Pseudofrankia]
MEQGRIDQFKADVSRLKVRTGDGRRDGVLQIVGIALMVVGIVVDLVVYTSSRNLNDPRDIQSDIILAIAFLAVAGAGAALFLYASLARFLRFWLLRQVYESQSQIDQVVAVFQPRRSEAGPGVADTGAPVAVTAVPPDGRDKASGDSVAASVS